MSNLTCRAFFRCLDCLSVFAVDGDTGYNNGADLPNCPCSGDVLFLGYTAHKPVYRREEVSACDGRCTEARGNSCDCVCGGDNHGQGRVAILVTREDLPTAPRQKIIDYAYGESYRARRAAILAAFPEIEQVRKGEWIADKATWRRGRELADTLHEIRYSLTKKKRDGLLAGIESSFNTMSQMNQEVA